MSVRQRRLVTLGDSHSVYCFAGVAEATIYWRGPRTMHRASREGIASLLHRSYKPKSGDALVLSFGEIDCRKHIPKQAKASGKTTLEEVDALCDRYHAALKEFDRTCKADIALCCIIPPNLHVLGIDLYPSREDAEADAKAIRSRMNDRLSMMGYPFVDFRPHFTAPDGALDDRFSDGNIHTDPRVSGPVIDAVRKSLGIETTHLDPPFPDPRPRAEPAFVSPWVKSRRFVKSLILGSRRQKG